MLSAIDEEAFYDFVLEQAPEFVAERKATEQEITAGTVSGTRWLT